MKEKHSCKITGDLTGNQEAVDKLIATGNIDLIIDFSECTFVSVPGMEWLEEMLLKAQSSSVNVSFVGMSPALYKVFKVARIESILAACGSPSASSESSPTC